MYLNKDSVAQKEKSQFKHLVGLNTREGEAWLGPGEKHDGN